MKNHRIFKENWDRNFIKYLSITSIIMMISNISQFALSLFTLRETHSVLLFSTALSLTIVPRLLLTPISGVVGDSFEKKTVMKVSCFLTSVLAFIALALYQAGAILTVVFVFAFILLLEIFEIFFSASSASVLPLIFSEEKKLGKANSISSVNGELVEVLASFIGGILCQFFSMTILTVLIGVAFLLAGMICQSLHLVEKVEQRNEEENAFDTFKAGLAYLKTKQVLIGLILICFLANFVIAPSFSISIIYTFNDILHLPSEEIGFYMGLMSAVGVLTSLALTKFYPKQNPFKIIAAFSCVIAVFFVLLSGVFVFSFTSLIKIMTILTYGTIIASNSVIGILLITQIQQQTESQFMSRVISAINFFATISVPLGQLLFGVLIDKVNITSTLVFSASLFFICMFVGLRLGLKEEMRG